jgi:phosphoglucosamine mutase
MKKKFFGTDGIRGKVGTSPITVQWMYRLGLAVAEVFSPKVASPVIIARDTRLSGAALQLALQAGLSSLGFKSWSAGVLPTPAVAYLARKHKAALGIMITASHNPYYDNGVKFFDSNGEKLSDDLEYAIESALLAQKNVCDSQFDDTDSVVVDFDKAGLEYIAFCKESLPSSSSLAGKKIVLDVANGAMFSVAPKVFSELGAEVYTIHNDPNGTNINKSCGATHLSSLQQAVVSRGADCGIAFDGDGDRCMMVDHQGEIVDGDQILCILAHHASHQGEIKGVVGTLMTNLGFEQSMNHAGIEFVRANVGDRYVLSACKQRGWDLGGEGSGHLINLKLSTTGDGVLSALQVLKAIGDEEKSLYELKQVMVKHPQVLLNVPVSQVVVLKDHPDLLGEIQKASDRLAGKGRILVRPSGTEPCVRVMAEGENEDEILSAANDLKAQVEKHLYALAE